MKDEYQSTRSEILQWQTLRITLITISTALVPAILTAILSMVLKDVGSTSGGFVASSVLCFVASFLLLAFLSVAVVLTWYAGTGNVKMGSYLAVFYEEGEKGWHHRHRVVNELSTVRADNLTFDKILSVFYSVLGVASLLLAFLPWLVTIYVSPEEKLPGTLYCLWTFPIVMFAVLFSLVVYLLFLPKKHIEHYRALWRIIKNAEVVGIKPNEEAFQNCLLKGSEDSKGWLQNTSPEKKMETLEAEAEGKKVPLDMYIQQKLRTDYKKESISRS
jgi:hypothetical protein